MANSQTTGWQELQTSSRRQCPKIFYQFSTDRDSLILLLTDLICIWETSLDKFDVLAAAARQHTSIDPSVSSKQFGVLLSKIQSSLKDGDNYVSRVTERNSQTLLLRTTSDLPKPLRPLQWTFTLEPQETSELAERILRPCLHEVAVSQTKLGSLLNIIKEKDHIISKLLDRIGNSAVDLSLVFPGIAGLASRKGGHVSIADAKKYVPNMAGFDEPTWTKQFANDDGYEGADRTGLGNLVRGCEKCFAHSKAEHDNWVRDLPTSIETNLPSRENGNRGSPLKQSRKRKSDADDDSTDDDFERQPTPPHLKSRVTPSRKTKSPINADDDEAQDEDEDIRSPKRSNPSKFGGIGHRSAQKPMRTSKTPPKAASSTRRASSASTASATASEDESNAVRPASRSAQSPQPAKKSRLGHLNKRTPATKSPSATPSPSPSPVREQPTRSVNTNNNNYHDAPGDTNPSKLRPSSTLETEDDNDNVNLGTSPSPPPRSTKKSKEETSPPAKAPRLGRLNNKKPPTPAKPVSPPAPQPDAEPDSEDEEDLSTKSPSKNKPSRLGGLRKKQAQKSEDPAPTSSPKTKPKDTSPAKAQSKPTTRGGDSEATASPSPSPSPPRTRSTDKPPQATPSQPPSHSQSQCPAPPSRKITGKTPSPAKPKETAEEAAARRRMELKRTIASADAAKKKRRF